MARSFYKKRDGDTIWWVRSNRIGEFEFSFDKVKVYNLFRDYPHALTKSQKEQFDKENPFWVKRLGRPEDEHSSNSNP